MSVTVLFALGETIWITGLATWIVLERRSPAATFAWVLALAWLPVLGIPLYLLIGPRRLRRKRLRYQRGRSRVAQASEGWREQTDFLLHGVPPIENSHPLIGLAEIARQLPPCRTSRVDLFLDGDACYDAIEHTVREAQQPQLPTELRGSRGDVR